MPAAKLDLDRRASEPGDLDSLFSLRAEALRGIVEGWNEDDERSAFTASFTPGAHVVAEDRGTVVAFWRVERKRNELFVAELFVKHSHQRQGIAIGVLRSLIDEALREDIAVAIHIPPRAQPLIVVLRELGFVVVPSPERGRSRLLWRA